MSQNFLTSNSIYFFGRPYAELLNCFGLTEGELRGRSILECPSGPSSFVLEANAAGANAIGIDPLFYRSPEAIRTLALADFRAMFDLLRQQPGRHVAKTYQSLDEAESRRRLGLERFLEDYAIGRAVGRYQVGSLPYLDFEDEQFDLVVCGHLLCVYAGTLDLQFHLASIRELCRVAREEVRIHPLIDGTNSLYLHLPALIREAEDLGFAAEVIEVNHEFFKGTNSTLTLRRR